MKTNELIVILMIIGIVLVVLSNFITLPSENKLKLKVVEQKALKLPTGNENKCIYKLNISVINEGNKLNEANCVINFLKKGEVIEVDKVPIEEINNLEVKKITKNYTRACNYLDNFEISFEK